MARELTRKVKSSGWLIVATLTLLSLWLLSLRAVPVEANSLSPRVELDQRVVLVGERRSVYLLVDFDVPETRQKPGQTRPRMNLALVLDRSGSMQARGKMEYAKKAAKLVVDQLKPTDRLAVVEYDDRVTLLWPSAPVESPGMIKRRIDKLAPRGSTNLTGGMMKGVEEVRANLSSDDINRVILLSDGLANRGITNPVEIKRLVRGAKRRGVSISTMGLGLKYNEDLMQAIAENSGGNYYYIESPTQMARIFRQEMSTVFATVAKEVKLAFRGGQMVEKVDVFGYPAEITGRNALVPMENFYSGEKRVLLLRLEIEAEEEGRLRLGQLELSYLDTTDNRAKRVSVDLKVTVSSRPELVVASRNKRVVVEANLIEADRRHEEYVRMYERGRRKEAKEGITALAKEIARRNATLSDVKLAKKLEALRLEAQEMERVARAPRARSAYLKASKQRLYQSKRGKRSKYILREGDTGYEVERLQVALRSRKLYRGPVDGRFSPEVTRAVREFQRQRKLKVDGVVGPRTMKELQMY